MNPEPVKICVITTVSITLRAFLLEQLVFLSQNGFDVTVVCDNDRDFARDCPAELKYIPVHMIRGIGWLSTFTGLWKLYRLFRIKKFSMIQYSTPKAALLSSLAGFMAGIPVRLYCQWGIRYVGLSGLSRRIFKLIEKLTCLLSTDIAPDSRGNLDFCVGEGLYPAEKAYVVHKGSANGVDLEKFDLAKKAVWYDNSRSELKIGKDCFVYGFVGRITRDKGINELVTAFIRMAESDAQIVLLLVGPKEERHGLEAGIMEAIDNHPRIYSVGAKSNPQEYIAAMDVMVLPSYREGFGIVAIESQAMGVPVIATDIPGPREAIINGETGILVPCKDAHALEEAMRVLRASKEMLDSMGRNGLEFVSEDFEQKRFWEKVLEHRRGLLSKRSVMS